jgi:hypothetical protein
MVANPRDWFVECMRGVPYIMPPNFFNGNYNRYREHNNTVK